MENRRKRDQSMRLEHRFVEHMPREPVEGMLYVSIRFGTAVHMCCCGCGDKVVTPFDPALWEMTFDGKTVSLSPSIGGYSSACQSHYWIRRGRVEWAPHLSVREIADGRRRDKAVRQQRFSRRAASKNDMNVRRSSWPSLRWFAGVREWLERR